MKTHALHTTSTALQPQKGNQPFFNKEGESAFFSSDQVQLKAGNENQTASPFFGGASGSSPFFSPSSIQTKLTIGQPGDKYEQEADAMADQVVQRLAVVGSGAGVQRKCAACSAEDKEQPLAPKLQPKAIFESNEEQPLQRKCTACQEQSIHPKHIQMQGGPSAASSDLESRLSATKGGGSPLPKDTRGSMESAFGADFSSVRVHTNSGSVQMNQELGAQAFTHGSDVYFNQGKYDTGSGDGQRLLAHELTHVVQQGGGGKIFRSLKVENPQVNIPNPGGGGVVKKNHEVTSEYLNMLCKAGGVTVNKTSGEVNIPNDFCTDPVYPPDFVGPHAPAPAKLSGTPTGCTCICDIVNSPNLWKIEIDDSSWPHTSPDDNAKGNTPGSGGTGGVVTAPSPNDEEAWGAVTEKGNFQDIDPWLILGHELCGHAWMMNTGDHSKDHTSARGRGGHQETVKRENLLRGEHGIEKRGEHRGPYCGESFKHKKGTVPSKGTVKMSGYLAECEKWRKGYNKLNGTNFKIEDNIPVKPGEKLP